MSRVRGKVHRAAVFSEGLLATSARRTASQICKHSSTLAMQTAISAPLSRAIPPWLIVLCALVFHGPLLIMQVPANSFDANFHMSMASHYAHHWFDPWNEKAFSVRWAWRSRPLTHQWTAILSHVIGLTNAYMLVQGIRVIELQVPRSCGAGVGTVARAASYAALCSI